MPIGQLDHYDDGHRNFFNTLYPAAAIVHVIYRPLDHCLCHYKPKQMVLLLYTIIEY